MIDSSCLERAQARIEKRLSKHGVLSAEIVGISMITIIVIIFSGFLYAMGVF